MRPLLSITVQPRGQGWMILCDGWSGVVVVLVVVVVVVLVESCCRILTTSSGVTASAVTMDPMEPESIRGRREDEEEDAMSWMEGLGESWWDLVMSSFDFIAVLCFCNLIDLHHMR